MGSGKKAKTVFFCTSCGHEEAKWLGRCPGCGEWNSLQEQKVQALSSSLGINLKRAENPKPQTLDSISLKDFKRHSTGLPEADQVLGGGLVEGSAILLGGEPGIGKSTLMLQIAGQTAESKKALYISGEESLRQIKLRAKRLGIESPRLSLYCESDSETIIHTLEEEKPSLVILDSIQTIHSPSQGLVPGTVNQLKYGCFELINWTRRREATLFLIAHVTKEGSIAGPKVIEHMVDTVLHFDHTGNDLRILRAAKNRFGPVDEIGLFRMDGRGLQQVTEPEALFLENREGQLPPGIAVAPVFEGSRVLLVEIQALTVPAKGGISRVFSDRIEGSRVSRVAAIMEKHLGLKYSDQDIYINVAGGMKVSEVGAELPLALALYSARTGIPLPSGLMAMGEMSLTGEIRPVPHLKRRLKAAGDMGFSTLLIPASNREVKDVKPAAAPSTVKAADIRQAVKLIVQKN